MRSPPFTIDQDTRLRARWPFWLAFFCALVAYKAQAVTVTVSGQSCQLIAARYQSDARLVIDGCNTVRLCGFAGATYTPGEMVVPGGCSVDLIYRGSFQ